MLGETYFVIPDNSVWYAEGCQWNESRIAKEMYITVQATFFFSNNTMCQNYAKVGFEMLCPCIQIVALERV